MLPENLIAGEKVAQVEALQKELDGGGSVTNPDAGGRGSPCSGDEGGGVGCGSEAMVYLRGVGEREGK